MLAQAKQTPREVNSNPDGPSPGDDPHVSTIRTPSLKPTRYLLSTRGSNAVIPVRKESGSLSSLFSKVPFHPKDKLL